MWSRSGKGFCILLGNEQSPCTMINCVEHDLAIWTSHSPALTYSAAVLSQNLVMASNFKRRTPTISNFRPHGKHFGFTTSNRTMIRCALALVLAGNFWSKAIAECLSDPALDAIFAGGTTIPLEGSCCQNDVCNIPCPEPVPAPGSGKSVRGYRVTLTVLDCTPSSLVHQTHVLFAFSLTLVCVPPY